MSEKRFYRASVCGDDGLYDKEDGCIIVNVNSNIDLNDNWNTVVDLLNEQQATISNLEKENENLKLKIVSLENEVQRQKNEIKNTKKEFTKKKEELNWLKSEDYLKKIY